MLPSTFDKDTSPIEYFQLFFYETLRTKIIDETYLFAQERKSNLNSLKSRMNRWEPLTDVDLKAFWE